jgi:hypothetical protein
LLENEGGAGMSILGGLFWGIFFLVAGLIVLLKIVLNLRVSAGRLVFGVFVLMVGVSLLIGSPGWGSFRYNEENTTIFSSSAGDIEVSSPEPYLSVFGSVTYDASRLEPGQSASIKCVFGSCRVILPGGSSGVKVTAHSVFGSIRTPDGAESMFGTNTYEKQGDNAINIDVACLFGSISVVGSD